MFELRRSLVKPSFLWLLIIYVHTCFAVIPAFDKKNLLLLEVTINQNQLPGIFVCYEVPSGKIWVNENDLKSWHFPVLSHRVIFYLGKKYHALNEYQDVHYDLHRKKLKMSIWVPSHYFPHSSINLSGYNPQPIRPQHPGLFLNYDLTAIRNNKTTNSALLELGFFNHFGIGTTDLLISNYHAFRSSALYRFIRLNTTWTLDEPEKIATFRVGDSITGASSYSGAARFAGIQYATNFNTQPNFISFPLPGFKGEAIVPTNVQIFVNGILNQRTSVENGVYLMNNIPVVTGAGVVSVVTQDLLGRTQTMSFSYYASPTLLKRGLENFSYETGFLRANYGINSNNYEDFLAIATYQRGLTDVLTAGLHAEWLTHQQTIGFSSDYLFNQLGIISLATATSHSRFGGGWLGACGFMRQTPTINFGLKSTYMSMHYQQLGLQTGKSGPLGAVTTNQFFFGYDTGFLGSFGLSYTVTKQFSVPRAISNPGPQLAKIGTATYSRGIFKNTSFILSVIKDFHQANNNQVYASFIISLDTVHALSAYGNYQNKQAQPALLYTRNLPLGNGYGYHVLATTNGTNGPGADFTYQNEVGTYTGRAYHVTHKNYYEADVSGAMIYFDRRPFLSRRMLQSFALVQVPGYENVRVYYQNQLAGRTNRQGNLLVPDILSYQKNTLTIESRDLPLNAEISHTAMDVLPYSRSGVIARFAVRESFPILLRLEQKNGDFVPVGADVTLADQTHYLMGYEGVLFISDYKHRTITGEVRWDNKHCHFAVAKCNSLRAQHVSCL